MNSYLEEEYAEPFNAWKANPTPDANAQILKTLHPVIEKGVRTHVGEPNPLLISRARKLTLDGLRSYDPNRSRLGTHLFNQYRGLKRIARQQSQVIQAPERVVQDAYQLSRLSKEMTDELGRDPTDAELSKQTGFSMKRLQHVRGYQPGVSEGALYAVDPGLVAGLQPHADTTKMWHELVYDDLPPIDQKIMEHTLGLHGHPVLSNQSLARKLGRSPGAISQRKLKIQQMLDQETKLSPFI